MIDVIISHIYIFRYLYFIFIKRKMLYAKTKIISYQIIRHMILYYIYKYENTEKHHLQSFITVFQLIF